jgi:Flp pilus assembly pilin Flp
MTELFTRVWITFVTRLDRDEHGQTTAEYALVLLAAAALAMVLLSWVKGSGAVKDLFDSVIDQIIPG